VSSAHGSHAQARSRSGTRRLAAAGVFVLIVVALLLVLRGRSHTARRAEPEQTDLSAASADLGRQAARALMAGVAKPTPIVSAPELTDRILKDYPPNSRPVTQSRAEAFKYNRRDLQFLGVPGPDKSGPPAFYSEFTADKFNVFEGETITLTLRAAKDPSVAAGAFPITTLGAGITKGRSQDAQKVLDLTFSDDGRNGDATAGDGTYTSTVEPSKVPALADYQGSVRAFVQFTANGSTFGHQLFFNYFPPKGIAGTFTGHFHEAIEDGSLVVYAEINVLQSGNFALDATLLTADDQAFCHSRFKGQLGLGTQDVRFLFFGKAIRDGLPAGGVGPFKVSEIYGMMVPDPEELLRLSKGGGFAPSAVPLFGGQYVTGQYEPSQFSDVPWQGRGAL
jgi:hypothetical protein